MADNTCVKKSNANLSPVQTVATEDTQLSSVKAVCENDGLGYHSQCNDDEPSDDGGDDNTNAKTRKADVSCELQTAQSPVSREDTANANTAVLWNETSEFIELDRMYSSGRHMRLLSVNTSIVEGSDCRFCVEERQRREGVWVLDATSEKNFRTFKEAMRCWRLFDNKTQKNRETVAPISPGGSLAPSPCPPQPLKGPGRAQATKRKNEAKDESDKKRLRVAVLCRNEAGQPLRAPPKGPFRGAGGGDRAKDATAYKEHGASRGARRCYGQIVQWYKEKGYGFVKGEEDQNSIFLHISNVNTGHGSLRTDDEILYDKRFDDKNQKYTAVNASIVEKRNRQAMQNSRPQPNKTTSYTHCQDRAPLGTRSRAEYAPYASEYNRRDSSVLVAREGPYHLQDHAESRFQDCDWQDDMADVFERDDHRVLNHQYRATYDHLTINGISSILLCVVNMFVLLRYVFQSHQMLT